MRQRFLGPRDRLRIQQTLVFLEPWVSGSVFGRAEGTRFKEKRKVQACRGEAAPRLYERERRPIHGSAGL